MFASDRSFARHRCCHQLFCVHLMRAWQAEHVDGGRQYRDRYRIDQTGVDVARVVDEREANQWDEATKYARPDVIGKRQGSVPQPRGEKLDEESGVRPIDQCDEDELAKIRAVTAT